VDAAGRRRGHRGRRPVTIAVAHAVEDRAGIVEHVPGRSAPATRHPTSPTPAGGKQTSPASTVAITAPTLPPIPLPSLPATGKSVVNAGSASGLFPTISATPSPSPSGPGATTGDVSAAAAGYQVPLAPAGLIIAILIALGGAGLGGRQYLHRRRDGKQ
jgi:hypothetical protein